MLICIPTLVLFSCATNHGFLHNPTKMKNYNTFQMYFTQTILLPNAEFWLNLEQDLATDKLLMVQAIPDLIDLIWVDRPPALGTSVIIFSEVYAGKSWKVKYLFKLVKNTNKAWLIGLFKNGKFTIKIPNLFVKKLAFFNRHSFLIKNDETKYFSKHVEKSDINKCAFFRIN